MSNLDTEKLIELAIDHSKLEYSGKGLDIGLYVEGINLHDSLIFEAGTAVAVNGPSVNGVYTNPSYKFQNCDFDTWSAAGFGMYLNNCSNIQVTDCWFSNGKKGLVARNTDGLIIATNQYYCYPTQIGAASTAITLGDASTPCVNVTVSGNISLGGESGLYVRQFATSVAITGNVISYAAGIGVTIESNTKGILLTSNLLRKNVGGNVSVGTGTSNILNTNNLLLTT